MWGCLFGSHWWPWSWIFSQTGFGWVCTLQKKNPYHWFTWEMRRNLDPLSLPWFPCGSISHDENLTPNICSIEHRSAHRKNNLQPKKEKEKGLGKGENLNYGYICDKYINTTEVTCVAGVSVNVTCVRPCPEQNRLVL